jgi:hypothetical protein
MKKRVMFGRLNLRQTASCRTTISQSRKHLLKNSGIAIRTDHRVGPKECTRCVFVVLFFVLLFGCFALFVYLFCLCITSKFWLLVVC